MLTEPEYQRGYILGALRGDGCFSNWPWKSASGKTYLYRKAEIMAIDKEMVEAVADFSNILLRVKSKLRGPTKNSTIASGKPFWQWKTIDKNFISKMESRMPSNREEWRGFISGFFDADGWLNKNKRCLGFGLKPIPNNKVLLGQIAEQLQHWGFFPKMYFYHNGGIGMLSLELNGMAKPKEILKLPTPERRLIKEKVVTRFFSIFQPRIQRKYPTK